MRSAVVLATLAVPVALSGLAPVPGDTVHATKGELGTAAGVIAHISGGRVLEIRVAGRDGQEGFDAVTATFGVLADMHLSPAGRVQLIPTREVASWMLNWRRRLDLASASAAKISMAASIKAAENAMKAPAVDAVLAQPARYDVEVIRNGVASYLSVDANTGRVLFEQSRPA